MTRFAGIIGSPVGHSLSPAFQSAAFAALGLDVSYELWETTPAQLPLRIHRLRDPQFLGANVTIPYKEDVAPMLDRLDPQAGRVGAINTIVNADGQLEGHNTDGPGFVAALRHAAFEPAGASFLLLGAGGAARGIAFGLAAAGAAAVSIANRTRFRAATLAHDVRKSFETTDVHVVPLDEPLGGFDCVVNCTSIGMTGTGTEHEVPRDLSGARVSTLVVDIVYAPAVTPFLRMAQEAGLAALGGLPMLVHQGGLAFELWTGLQAPIDVMRGAAEDALAARERSAPDGGRR